MFIGGMSQVQSFTQHHICLTKFIKDIATESGLRWAEWVSENSVLLAVKLKAWTAMNVSHFSNKNLSGPDLI